MHRFVGDLGAEVGAGGIQEIIIQMPVQRGPRVVEHPVDDAGGGFGRLAMRIERLELRPDVVVVVELCLGDVVLKALGCAVALRQRGVERLERREYRPGGGGVILPRLGVFPQGLELLRREHAMQVFQQRYRGARADLGVESEGAAELVGIPVRRRNPRVGPGHFHAGRTGLGGGLVHGGRDDRQRPVFGVQSVDVQLRDRCRRRVVAADQKADHGRMVAEQSRLARHGRCSHFLVRGVPGRAARLGPRLPFVAAFPAGEDHDAVTVGEVVESRVLELALAAQGIEPQVHDVAELGLHALGVITQEQVRRPARAADQHRLAVDDELLIPLRGEVGTDAADAERRDGPVGHRTVGGSRHLQAVERMRTHADRPPDLWMVEIEARIALRGK